MEEFSYRSHILNLGTRWRWVDIFTVACVTGCIPGEGRAVAQSIHALSGLQLVRTMVVLSAAFVLFTVGPQVIILQRHVPRTTPFGVYSQTKFRETQSVDFK
jgi:hypothetical protein